jgi:hypothetical protein
MNKDFTTIINTSGNDGKKIYYKDFNLKSGKEKRTDKDIPEGGDGDDGINGFCGENGGDIILKVRIKIINESRLELKSNGGNGSDGLDGLPGDEGKNGIDGKSGKQLEEEF